MRKSKSRRSVGVGTQSPPEPAARAAPERYIRWRNDTGEMIEPVLGGTKVRWWTPGLVRSVPESMTDEAEKAGLTKVGFVQ